MFDFATEYSAVYFPLVNSGNSLAQFNNIKYLCKYMNSHSWSLSCDAFLISSFNLPKCFRHLKRKQQMRLETKSNSELQKYTYVTYWGSFKPGNLTELAISSKDLRSLARRNGAIVNIRFLNKLSNN